MAKPGRKPWIPTAGDIANVHRWAGQGISKEGIYRRLGISNDTGMRRRKQIAEFEQAFTRGLDEAEAQVTGWLMDIISNNDPKLQGSRVNAIKLWLQHVAGWREKTEISGSKDSPFTIQHRVGKGVSVQQILEEFGKKRNVKIPG